MVRQKAYGRKMSCEVIWVLLCRKDIISGREIRQDEGLLFGEKVGVSIAPLFILAA